MLHFLRAAVPDRLGRACRKDRSFTRLGVPCSVQERGVVTSSDLCDGSTNWHHLLSNVDKLTVFAQINVVFLITREWERLEAKTEYL